MPMLALGSTCILSVHSRLTNAIALCRVTCFLRLVSITSRHCSTMMMSSFGAPEERERERELSIGIQIHNAVHAAVLNGLTVSHLRGDRGGSCTDECRTSAGRC